MLPIEVIERMFLENFFCQDVYKGILAVRGMWSWYDDDGIWDERELESRVCFKKLRRIGLKWLIVAKFDSFGGLAIGSHMIVNEKNSWFCGKVWNLKRRGFDFWVKNRRFLQWLKKTNFFFVKTKPKY